MNKQTTMHDSFAYSVSQWDYSGFFWKTMVKHWVWACNRVTQFWDILIYFGHVCL